MNKALIGVLIAIATLTGCEKASESTVVVGVESDFKVGRLFTVDGCTAYRFYDNGHAIYYTNCKGTTSWEVSKSNGKVTATEYMTVDTK